MAELSVWMSRGSSTAAGGRNQPRSVEAKLHHIKASCHHCADDETDRKVELKIQICAVALRP